MLRATPFHARAQEANRLNAWSIRGGYTLASHYGDANEEALALRLAVGLADISWHWRPFLGGGRVDECLARIFTRDPAKLAVGEAVRVLWLNDQGAVRGQGVVARYGRDTFRIIAPASDAGWISSAAGLFDVRIADISEDEVGLALIGPYAVSVLEVAGLAPDLAPLSFRRLAWRGLNITLSRWNEFGGFEIWCRSEDAWIVWDRLARAGKNFALVPAGVKAMDMLALEHGLVRPGHDYSPARDKLARDPSPDALGLSARIDSGHVLFNGRTALLAAQNTTALAGVEFDGATPCKHAPLTHHGRVVGKTLGSAYSPALRRAIALAEIEQAFAKPGTELTLPGAPGFSAPPFAARAVRVTALPFLP